MKKKIGYFDKRLLKNFLNIVLIISTVSSLFFIFFHIPDKCKLYSGIVCFIILLGIYSYLWYKANNMNSVSLNINETVIDIEIGDIFNETGIKVIPFNEYFDTIIDDVIISKNSLNGIFINKIINEKRVNLEELNKKIENELSDKKIIINHNRKKGKKIKYKLGTIFEYDDYFLTAMTKFDNDNRAKISQKEFLEFLLEFWENIDIKYNNRKIIVPLLGLGITRFERNIKPQELLSQIIWIFKLSQISLKSGLKIIIHENMKEQINLYEIKEILTN
ncbi:DUF6430 domain-containing protein [Fusobacterium animalis]|uniref:macro domain-containing protein n=1 Tax=Fusobacterium animalis TaxID=76859 RepID=UPI0030D1A646